MAEEIERPRIPRSQSLTCKNQPLHPFAGPHQTFGGPACRVVGLPRRVEGVIGGGGQPFDFAQGKTRNQEHGDYSMKDFWLQCPNGSWMGAGPVFPAFSS